MTSALQTQQSEPQILARKLGISAEAVALCRSIGPIDLHIDTFIPPRIWGYDALARHSGGPLGRHFFGHLDLPRMREGGLAGAMWSITTNPFRPPADRWQTFQRNWKGLNALIERSQGALRMVTSEHEYRVARNSGAHAVIPSIQGGNALEAAPDGALSLPFGQIVRVTLVHLTSSVYGATSSPHHLFRRSKGLSRQGIDLVRQLDALRIFVDLAHIHPAGFWDAVQAHAPERPLLATHTGVTGVRPHWRNLDDAQLKAIAESGGTVGVIFATNFLSRPNGPDDARMVVEHMDHIIQVVGEDHVSVGSDYDGAISPPPDLRDGEHYPVLVQRMLDAQWSNTRIEKVLAQNFLRAFRLLRPPSSPSVH